MWIQNQHLNRSHNLPNVIVQQSTELQVRDQLLLSDKQALVPGGAIVRNPSPSQNSIKLPANVGKGKGNTGNPSLFSELSTANNPSNMETLGVKLSAKTAHLADDVSLSRITRYDIIKSQYIQNFEMFICANLVQFHLAIL